MLSEGSNMLSWVQVFTNSDVRKQKKRRKITIIITNTHIYKKLDAILHSLFKQLVFSVATSVPALHVGLWLSSHSLILSLVLVKIWKNKPENPVISL